MGYALLVIGLITVASVLLYLARKPRQAVAPLTPTYNGPISEYDGGKTLLVAVYASWTPVWRATAEALGKADPASYDVKLIDADGNKQAVQNLGVEIIPTVIVFKDGQEIARLPNMLSLDQLPA